MGAQLSKRGTAILWIVGGTLVDLTSVMVVATTALGILFGVLSSPQAPPARVEAMSADSAAEVDPSALKRAEPADSVAEVDPSPLKPPEPADSVAEVDLSALKPVDPAAAAAAQTPIPSIRAPEERAGSSDQIAMPGTERQSPRRAASTTRAVGSESDAAAAKLNRDELDRIGTISVSAIPSNR
jgi:hypothetical protein